MYMVGNSDSQPSPSEQPKSHVHGLLERLAASPSRIAPERVKTLKALVKKHAIEIQINDNDETSFDMGTMFGRIFTPMRVYHHLWSAALFFAALYIERDVAAKEGKAEVDLNNPAIELVWGNYLLSCERFKEDREFPFPAKAQDITPRADYIELADDLFLGMVAFCLLHEVAHLESGDSKTGDDGALLNQIDPHEMEYKADKWAYDWILSRWSWFPPHLRVFAKKRCGVTRSLAIWAYNCFLSRWSRFFSDPRVFVKRTLGIIFSLAMMDEFRHHKDNALTSSHPAACDRLLRFFEDYNGQITSNEWGATCLTATYIGLQVVAVANNYILPREGYSDPISFLNLVKEVGPGLAAEAKARRVEYEAEQSKNPLPREGPP